MNEILEPIATVVPAKYAGQLALLMVASQVFGRIFQSLRNGGGLKSLLASVWLGTNTPTAKQPGRTDDPNQKRLFSLLAVGCAAFALAGCASTPEAKRIQSAAKVAAYVGTHAFLADRPGARMQFELARDSLKQLESAEQIDFATLLAIVQRLPVSELKSETAVLVITSATIILSDYAGSIPVERLEELKPLVTAIRQGIELGLGP